jgi:hypothetical protein
MSMLFQKHIFKNFVPRFRLRVSRLATLSTRDAHVAHCITDVADRQRLKRIVLLCTLSLQELLDFDIYHDCCVPFPRTIGIVAGSW